VDDDGEEKELMERLKKLSVPASDEEDEVPAPIPRGGKKTKVSHMCCKQGPQGGNLDHPTDFSGPFIL